MSCIFLTNPWVLSFKDPKNRKQLSIPAQVPGNVLGDLQRAGMIPDPYFGNNSDALRPYEFIDWEYRTTFSMPEFSECETLQLVFEGIDTVAEVILNGRTVGNFANMFIEHRITVERDWLLLKENELVVRIQSPVNYARQFKPVPYNRVNNPYCFESLFVRRPMHTYGWDIAPRLVGAGLWRPVKLEILKPTRWTDLYLATVDISAKSALLQFCWNFTTDAADLMGYEAHLVFQCGDHHIEKHFPLYFTSGAQEIRVSNPRLWFPHGSGEANLYTVTLELIRYGKIVDTRILKTGIRTIELQRTETLDESGKGEFVFLVNGRKTFIMGSNWVPSDALHGEHPERVKKNLDLFLELGCNMVRCWGGNVYEDQSFFDYCDEHGLMVWQDFMFACETSPQNAEFLDAVRQEAESVIRALRNHPSLALWCGDNECDELFFFLKSHAKLLPSTNRISRELLPHAVAMLDPVRDYLPSSPYLSDELKLKNARYRSTEQHLWGPRDTWKGRFYKENCAVFASETGYHGMTDAESIRRFIPESELNNRHGMAWNCHASQQCGNLNGPYSYRNKLMEDQAKGFWGYLADDLTEFMKCSQIVQAEAVKFLIELFRTAKWNKTGLIWWNVIDCWPQFSDAVTDYYYVRKLAFYYIKQIQQPVTLIVSDPEAWNCSLTAVNDTAENVTEKYKVTDLMTGELFAEGEFEVQADSAVQVCQFPVCQGEQRMLLIEWENGGKTSYNHYLLGNAPFNFAQYGQWLKKLAELIYKKLGWNEW